MKIPCKDHQHMSLLREANDLKDHAPDISDYEVLETVFQIVQHPHSINEHLPEECALCKSIIEAYDHGFFAGQALYAVYYGS